MKVYKMYHIINGTGPIATSTEDVINEIECELNDFGEVAKLGYTKANLSKLKRHWNHYR